MPVQVDSLVRPLNCQYVAPLSEPRSLPLAMHREVSASHTISARHKRPLALMSVRLVSAVISELNAAEIFVTDM